MWDFPSLQERAVIKAHKSDVWSVAFFPDSKAFASGDGDWDQPGEVKLWSADMGKAIKTLNHTGEVLCIAVSPDGKLLAAGSWDKTIKLWDLSRFANKEPGGRQR